MHETEKDKAEEMKRIPLEPGRIMKIKQKLWYG